MADLYKATKEERLTACVRVARNIARTREAQLIRVGIYGQQMDAECQVSEGVQSKDAEVNLLAPPKQYRHYYGMRETYFDTWIQVYVNQ
jgi:hypothetical protein